jgi:hypothetical protein
MPVAAKHDALVELEVWYRKERGPCLRRLERLQERIRSVALSGL